MEPPLRKTSFSLDVSGIAGFFGGDEAISAMDSILFYKYRKWLGWYNSPGSYTVAKHYGKLAKSRFWHAIYPGVNDETAAFLGLDGQRGPKYRGIVSGTVLSTTGHIGHIFAQHCRPDAQLTNSLTLSTKTPERRRTTRITVTIAEFSGDKLDKPEEIRLTTSTTISSPWDIVIALFPIIFSVGCCIVCGISEEWYAAVLILLGILSNGIACYIIGSAEIYLFHPKPSRFCPPGDGIMEDGDHFIVLKGSERAINYVVKSKFRVKYRRDPSHTMIGLSALALAFQFLAQLFLIPQSGLFGQILFLASLTVSWMYNAYLSSINKEQLQRDILKGHMPLVDWASLPKQTMELPTRTSAVVFAMVCALPAEYLQRFSPNERSAYARNILDPLLPKDTTVWEKWRELILDRVERFLQSELNSERNRPIVELRRPHEDCFTFTEKDWNIESFEDSQKNLLRDLLLDAHTAYKRFSEMKAGSPPTNNVAETGEECIV